MKPTAFFGVPVFDLLFTGLVSTNASAQSPSAQIQRGEAIYVQKCVMCHQITGQGAAPVYPPLAQNDWLAANREKAVLALCQGLGGPLVVNGTAYNNVMPTQILDDTQVADVLTYVGSSWGNQLQAFTSEEVSVTRRKSRYPTYAALLTATAYQPLPKAPEGWTLREVAQLSQMCTRFAGLGAGHPVYVLGGGGAVFELDVQQGLLTEIIRAAEYGIEAKGDYGSSAFTVDRDGHLWIVTNQRQGNKDDDSMWMNSVVIWRTTKLTDGRPSGLTPWYETSYPYGGGPYNHGVSHIAFGPDGLLYLNSGARTDGGEPGKPPKYFSGAETDITACLWRMDPKAAEPKIEVIARGIRNAFGFAWDQEAKLFTASNGPDKDQPEEMDFIETGRHYGFPYQFGNLPATEGSPYKHTPKAPEGLEFTLPIANLGPAAGGKEGAPCYTFDPHSSPAGMIWCGEEFAPPLRGSFLITRFGNLIDCPVDVGFDVLSVRPQRKGDGRWEASVQTILAPLGRPIDVHSLGGGRVLILEYTRPTNQKSRVGWLPGRILELAPTTH